MLMDCGFWLPWENVTPLRLADPTFRMEEPTDALLAACRLEMPALTADLDAALRHDLTTTSTARPMVAIDDSQTTDVDDAISYDAETRTLHVYIADPTSVLDFSSDFVQWLATRIRSVYLPERTVHMLPAAMVSAFSLSTTASNRAVEFSMQLPAVAGGSIENFGVRLVQIAPIRRVTYQEVDAVLRGAESPLPSQVTTMLRDLTAALHSVRQSRMAQAGPLFDFPSQAIALREEGCSLSLRRNAEMTAAEELVAECMILTGSHAAQIAERAGIAFPFRGQLEPQMVTGESLDPTGVAEQSSSTLPLHEQFERMLRMQSALTSPSLQAHYSLGLQAYSHVTSPIRRFSDMLAHHQLKCLLADTPQHWWQSKKNREAGTITPKTSQPTHSPHRQLLTADGLSKLLLHVDHVGWQLKRMEKVSAKHWAQEYLRRFAKLYPEHIHPCTVLESTVVAKGAVVDVMMDEFGLQQRIFLRGSEGLPAGQTAHLRLAAIVRQGTFWKMDVHLVP